MMNSTIDTYNFEPQATPYTIHFHTIFTTQKMNALSLQ